MDNIPLRDVHCLKLLSDLFLEKKTDESEIIPFCEYIDKREDCADFKVTTIIRLLYQFGDKLSEEANERLKKTILGFKYWMDEPGIDNMCYWSENHQILFAQCEYLAGQLYPNEVFRNSGMTGTDHLKKARIRILNWLNLHFHHGFIEWHSHVYYVEDISALINLIDFCNDEEIKRKAKIILDLLFLDIALHSFQGILGCTHGRSYEKQKKSGLSADITPIISHAFGFNLVNFDDTKIHSLFKYVINYRVPQIIIDIALDNSTVEIKDSMGFDLKEMKKLGFNMHDLDIGLILWAMEAFTNPESIEVTMDMLKKYRMMDNLFLSKFKAISHPLLRKLRLLPLISKVLKPVTNGIAIQKANSYTYKTRFYSMSTAQKHHVGEYGDQQHIWQATLAPHLNVFTTHPAWLYFSNPYLSLSPNYWVGSARLPHSVQHQNINLTIYKLPKKKAFLEKEILHFTHAYFPQQLFDEVKIEENYIFGRYQNTFIALIGKNKLEVNQNDQSDIIQKGLITYWICELGDILTYKNFDEFIEIIKSRKISFHNLTLTYENLRVTYKGDFYVNNKKVDLNYERFDTPYIKGTRKDHEYTIKFKDKTEKLEWK